MQNRNLFFIRTLAIASMALIMAPGPGRTAEPALARLSYWIPPERMAEFEVAYREQVLPYVERYGWVESAERGRAVPDSHGSCVSS